MGRRPQPAIRQRLLEACTDYALANGLPDRLGPLAEAAGVSNRMLIYHFGTRDQLLHEVLRQARQRQVAAFTEAMALRPDEPYVATLTRAWTAISGPTGDVYFRIFRPLHDDAGGLLWPDFRREATLDWIAPLEEGLASLGRPELATLALAVLRGLLMDLEATSDRERTDRAFADFLSMLAPAAS